jgi:hypothetical protein
VVLVIWIVNIYVCFGFRISSPRTPIWTSLGFMSGRAIKGGYIDKLLLVHSIYIAKKVGETCLLKATSSPFALVEVSLET